MGVLARSLIMPLSWVRPAGFEPATDGLEVVAQALIVITVTCLGLRMRNRQTYRRRPPLTLVSRPIGHVAGTPSADAEKASDASDHHERQLEREADEHEGQRNHSANQLNHQTHR